MWPKLLEPSKLVSALLSLPSGPLSAPSGQGEGRSRGPLPLSLALGAETCGCRGPQDRCGSQAAKERNQLGSRACRLRKCARPIRGRDPTGAGSLGADDSGTCKGWGFGRNWQKNWGLRSKSRRPKVRETHGIVRNFDGKPKRWIWEFQGKRSRGN